jgi:hypothetical protein
MGTDEGLPRDLSRLVPPLSGSVEQTGNPFEPFRLEGVGCGCRVFP